MGTAILHGLVLDFGLILPLGAQNTFVLIIVAISGLSLGGLSDGRGCLWGQPQAVAQPGLGRHHVGGCDQIALLSPILIGLEESP